MSNLPLLYKQSNTGAMLTWQIEVEDNSYRTISGQIDGALTTTKWTACFGKNTGKANATTDAEQAYKEAESKWEKKQEREHYTPDIDAARAGVRMFLEPMLAQDFKKRKDKIKWGTERITVQVKLNGVRCVATKDGLFSRKGKEYVSAPHISQQLKTFFNANPNVALDGELFNDELRQNLNKLVSLVRQETPTPENLIESEDLVQFHVYDCFNVSEEDNDTYSKRSEWYTCAIQWTDCPSVRNVLGWPVSSETEVDILLSKFESEGHEGAIIRLEGPYEHKRSKYLLKHKSFVDDEFTIVGVVEGKGNLEGKVGTLSFIARNGNPFESALLGTHELWEKMWNDRAQLIGKQATVKYKELTPLSEDGAGGVPSFGKVVAVRDYE